MVEPVVMVGIDDPRLSRGLSQEISAAQGRLGNEVMIPAILDYYRDQGWTATLFADLAAELGYSFKQLLDMISYNFIVDDYRSPPSQRKSLLQEGTDSFYLFRGPESTVRVDQAASWWGESRDYEYRCLEPRPVLVVEGPHLLSWLKEYDSIFCVWWEATELRIQPSLIEVGFEVQIRSSIPSEVQTILERKCPVWVAVEGSPGDYLLAGSD